MTHSPATKKPIPGWLTRRIPCFKTATYYPPLFDDSTHELWLLTELETGSNTNLPTPADGFLKVCTKVQSPFWQIMQHLFEVNLPEDIRYFKPLYHTVASISPLLVPQLLAAESASQTSHLAYLLTTKINGVVVTDVKETMVKQLAQHLARLHQQAFDYWGSLTLPLFLSAHPENTQNHLHKICATQWTTRLSQTLDYFSQKQSIPAAIRQQALHACAHIYPSVFVPMMPDLRWDQFLQQNHQLTALVDLDAFVLAPRELDFVLLEYILTPEQLPLFAHTYEAILPLPDLTRVRPAYRLLLLLMQVLGERDTQGMEDWMSVKPYFSMS